MKESIEKTKNTIFYIEEVLRNDISSTLRYALENEKQVLNIQLEDLLVLQEGK